MERKLRSKAGQAIYALRKTVVEPVFGQNKGSRGLNPFRLRGLEQVTGEWALMATTYNLLKLFRATTEGRLEEASLRRLIATADGVGSSRRFLGAVWILASAPAVRARVLLRHGATGCGRRR